MYTVDRGEMQVRRFAGFRRPVITKLNHLGYLTEEDGLRSVSLTKQAELARQHVGIVAVHKSQGKSGENEAVSFSPSGDLRVTALGKKRIFRRRQVVYDSPLDRGDSLIGQNLTVATHGDMVIQGKIQLREGEQVYPIVILRRCYNMPRITQQQSA